MIDVEKRLKTLLRPPSVVNWVRHNLRRLDETQSSLRLFALRPPRHSLSSAYKLIAGIAYKDFTEEEALKKADAISQPIARMAAKELIPCFTQYAMENNLEGVKDFHGFQLPYPVGRAPDGKTLTIPLRPTFVALDGDKLIPYFVIGWSTLALVGYQKRLLSTILCNSLLTHQSFLGSDAQIVGLPRIKHTKTRFVQEWSARMYGDLTEGELQEQFDRYGKALALIARELRGE